MKKILFITPHRKNRAPNQRFRFEQYLDYLKDNGFQCDLSPLIATAEDDRLFYGKGNLLGKSLVGLRAVVRRINDILRKNDYDIIFIAREAFMTGSTFFEKNLRKSRAKIVFDFDDAIWINTISGNNKVFGWLKDAGKTSTIISLSDLIIAGNSFLASYAQKHNNNVITIPTTIDTLLYRPAYRTDKPVVTIGWSGSTSTIEHFETAIPALIKLKDRYGDKIEFIVIGDPGYHHPNLHVTALPWKSESEINDLHRFDIGIMPLPDNEWARGKCGLKGLQYMALEIPAVMSPVGVNQEIITDGVNGFLADSVEEWVKKMGLLIESSQLRLLLGKAGRETVVSKYSVESQKERYLEVFRSLA